MALKSILKAATTLTTSTDSTHSPPPLNSKNRAKYSKYVIDRWNKLNEQHGDVESADSVITSYLVDDTKDDARSSSQPSHSHNSHRQLVPPPQRPSQHHRIETKGNQASADEHKADDEDSASDSNSDIDSDDELPISSSSSSALNDSHSTNSQQQPSKKRKRRKEEPLELPANKPIALSIPTISQQNYITTNHLTHYKPNDPRFDNTAAERSGTSNKFESTVVYNNAYKFIDELKQQETREMEDTLKMQRKDKGRKHKKVHLSEEEVQQLKQQLQANKQELKLKERNERQRETLQRWKREENKMRAQGKTAFYLKMTDVKRLQLADKYMELRDENGAASVTKAIEKRQKKRSQKDRRLIPTPTR